MTQGPASPSLRMSRAMALSSGAPLEQSAVARTCGHPDCTTTLSRYNPDQTCARHGGWIAEAPPRRRRRRSQIEVAQSASAEDTVIVLDADVNVDV